MLEVKNIKINYGGIEAVRDISFQVPNGKIVTLVGANGAGKSLDASCNRRTRQNTGGCCYL